VYKSESTESSEGEYETEFVIDPEYDGSPYQSQACIKHGVHYVPTGWKEIRVKRK